MSLIVEDGSALNNAESYISVADADTYHTAMGNHSWAAIPTVDKESYLRQATWFMIGRYRNSWKGARVKPTQALDWPRVGVVIDDIAGALGPQLKGAYGLYQLNYTTIPNEIKNCCADLALKALSGPLTADLGQNVIKKTVGPITVEYDKDSNRQIYYQQIEVILQPFLVRTAASVRLGRC